MLRKTEQIAMFAVAAFALVGMLGSPAFAAERTFTHDIDAPSSGSNVEWGVENPACGPSTTATLESTVSNNVDAITAEWDVNCGATFDEITIDVWRENTSRSGSPDGTYNTTDDDHQVTFTNITVNSGDNFLIDYIIDY